MVAEVEDHVEVRLVLVERVEGHDVWVRGEEVEDLGLREEAPGVEGVAGGGHGEFVDGFDGVGGAGGDGGAPEDSAEPSPAELLRYDVVSMEG